MKGLIIKAGRAYLFGIAYPNVRALTIRTHACHRTQPFKQNSRHL